MALALTNENFNEIINGDKPVLVDLLSSFLLGICNRFQENSYSHKCSPDPRQDFTDRSTGSFVGKVERYRADLTYVKQGAEQPDHDNDEERFLLCSIRTIKNLFVLRRPFFACQQIETKSASEDKHYYAQKRCRYRKHIAEKHGKGHCKSRDTESITDAEEIDEIDPSES